MRLALESPAQPDVLRLIDALDAYQRPLYPPASHHGIDLAALLAPAVIFGVARDDEGTALGARCFAQETGYLQTTAIALDARCGYARCAPFGSYLEDPNSVFMMTRVATA